MTFFFDFFYFCFDFFLTFSSGLFFCFLFSSSSFIEFDLFDFFFDFLFVFCFYFFELWPMVDLFGLFFDLSIGFFLTLTSPVYFYLTFCSIFFQGFWPYHMKVFSKS